MRAKIRSPERSASNPKRKAADARLSAQPTDKIKIFPTRFEFTLPAPDIVGLWLRDLRRELFRRPVIICPFNPSTSLENDKAQSIPLLQSFFFFCAKPVVGLLNPVVRFFVCFRIIVSKKILISICAILPDVFCVY